MRQPLIAIAPAVLLLLLPRTAVAQATGGNERADHAARLPVVAADAPQVRVVPVPLGAARMEPSLPLPAPRDAERATLIVERWTLDHAAPAPAASPRRSGWRSVGWGTLAGAAAGTVSGLAVAAACDDYCDGTRAQGVMLHVGVGAALGAVVGGIVHRMRESVPRRTRRPRRGAGPRMHGDLGPRTEGGWRWGSFRRSWTGHTAAA